MSKKENMNICKIHPLTNKRKKRIFASIQDIKNKIFNIEYLKQIIKSTQSLEMVEITKLLNINVDNNEYIKCIFMENQFAWVSKNEYGKERYFSKGHFTYGLDIYDLLTIYFNCTYSQVTTYLIEMGYNQADNFKKESLLKYEHNINRIKDIVVSNDILKELLIDKIDIYMSLNDFAKINALSLNTYNNEEVFFISTKYLKEIYNLKYSISTINQVINLYALIGLIYKVPENILDNDIHKAYAVNKKKSPINFYAIPKLDKVETLLKENSRIINKHSISYYDLTEEKANRLQEIRDVKVSYTSNKGGGHKTKRAKQSLIEKNNIETIFSYYLDREGVVAKEWIKEHKDITIKNTAFDKKWKELISKNEGKIAKPNKKLKITYNLKTNQELFIGNIA